jgi:hypothetical protein
MQVAVTNQTTTTPAVNHMVYTAYCHGGILREVCSSSESAVRLYSRRLIAGITSSDQGNERHVSVVSVVQIDATTGETVYEVNSGFFPCEHDGKKRTEEDLFAAWESR